MLNTSDPAAPTVFTLWHRPPQLLGTSPPPGIHGNQWTKVGEFTDQADGRRALDRADRAGSYKLVRGDKNSDLERDILVRKSRM